MFGDLIGSTALSSRLDPEDLRAVIRAYQEWVATTIQQFDGFIARYVGDGVLMYLGWPTRRQQAKLLELQAASVLAQFWRDHGNVAEARDLPGPIYHWFTEAFDAPDLNDAKALLGELA